MSGSCTVCGGVECCCPRRCPNCNDRVARSAEDQFCSDICRQAFATKARLHDADDSPPALTPGERTIWAASYAAAFSRFLSETTNTDVEIAVLAAQEASRAVDALRDVSDLVRAASPRAADRLDDMVRR